MAIDTMLRTLISSIFAITFGITGIYLTVQYLRAKALSRQTSTWPSTEGKITASWVKNKIGTVRGTRAVIKYTYTVMGKTFESDKMSAADSFDMQAWGPQADSRRVVKQYPSGSKVMVYYDPQNPANAVLRHDLNSPTGQGLVLSVVLVDMVAIAAIGYTLFNLL